MLIERRGLYSLVLSVATVCCLVMAGTAAAEDSWLWEGAKAMAAHTVFWKDEGIVLFEDMAVGARVECEDITGEGTVGSAAGARFDTTEKLTIPVAKCRTPAFAENLKKEVVMNDCGSLVASDEEAAVNLPWLTELQLNGTTFLDLLLSGGTGEPGFKLSCVTIFGILISETCKTENATMEVNNISAADVDAVIPATTAEGEFFNCSMGGAKSGLVIGTFLITSPLEQALAVGE